MVKQGWEYGTVRPRGSRRAKGWAGLEAGVGVDCEVWGWGGGGQVSRNMGTSRSRAGEEGGGGQSN